MAEEELDMHDDNMDDDDELEASTDNDSDDDSDSDSDSNNDSEDLAAAAASAHSSLAARNKVRESMSAEIEAFLARGGQIKQVDDNVMADPPRKPQSSYGSRPI
ncbi:MAG: hypothetical protein COB09_06655 [Thalassobium sp.]|jgi:hypothetical protein|uniref:Transcriptional regulator SutA RNAP-binding domain-containing protein n=1 Tax=Thalassolituus pacificus TaxID=2975440 RepID=A0A9X3AGZ9_9GAMM|nr:hypothetical protein [Thalassolituus pacificus]MCT7358966.1 hypothetical protein [Thalassolituus pacificus]PHS65435.1 MAG: hypothetical protein COB09_06655 [Thalassobium sp.]